MGFWSELRSRLTAGKSDLDFEAGWDVSVSDAEEAGVPSLDATQIHARPAVAEVLS